MSALPDRLPDRVDEPRANHLRGGGNRPTGGADSYALDAASSTAPARVGPLAVDRLRSLLSDRELDVIASVDRFRYLTAGQLQALHFHDHRTELTATRTCRRVLERLTGGQLLRRLDRRIGGVRAGSSSFVYGLAPLGHRVLHHDAERKRWREPSLQFLSHTLAIADIAVELRVEARRGEFDVLALDPEPASWRGYQKGLGGWETVKPDLFLALGTSEYEDHWFVEVDLGTESIPVVLRKCAVYSDYYRTGQEQSEEGVFPRVIWLTKTAGRAARLRSAISTARNLRRELFSVGQLTEAVTLLKGGAS